MKIRLTLQGAWLAAALALGGCGFTPLYSVPGVGAGLSHIEVIAPRQDPLQARVGYLLHEDLDDDFGHDPAAAPVYRLDMVLRQSQAGHGLTVNDVAQRYEIDMRVEYTLTEIATGKIVHSGFVISNVSYDSANQPYAGIAARQDTQDRIATDAAQKIEVQVAAWMANRPSS